MKLLALILTLTAVPVFAQDAMVNMQEIAQALGVECSYCHARMGGQTAQPPADGSSSASSKMAIAGAMIQMTRDLNAKILAATGKSAAEAARVQCVTCHRGVTIPGQLSDIIAKTAVRTSPEAAVTQYRELRTRYYGRDTYDFSEESLLNAAQQIVRVKPAASIPVLRLNLEFYPKSVRSYTQIAYAYTRSLDDEAAISALEKAIEIEPENGVVKGQLEQLKSYRRKR